MRPPAQALGEIATGRLRVAERRPAFQLRFQVPVAQFQCGGQGAGPRRTQARQARQLRRRPVQQRPQRAMAAQ